MNPSPALGWPELRQLLDYSYRSGNGAETFSLFQQQRTEAVRIIPKVKDQPLSAHGKSAEWAEALFCNCPELQPSPVDTSFDFSTRMFLAYFLKTFADNRAPDTRLHEVLLLLQKRFEVNRRIFAEYDKDIRRIGDDFTSLDNYALLSLALQITYLGSGCFSFLNTSIKVLDLVVLSGWEISSPQMFALPFALEKRILNELQAS